MVSLDTLDRAPRCSQNHERRIRFPCVAPIRRVGGTVLVGAIGRSRTSLENNRPAPATPILIFSDNGFCCRRRAGRRRRDGEGDPGIPATWTILCGKLSVSLEIEIALHVADRKKETDLGTDANHLGLEAADTVT